MQTRLASNSLRPACLCLLSKAGHWFFYLLETGSHNADQTVSNPTVILLPQPFKHWDFSTTNSDFWVLLEIGQKYRAQLPMGDHGRLHCEERRDHTIN